MPLRLLLDTHALIWWLTDDAKLGRRAYRAIADRANTIAVSAVSAMEVTTKYRIGKLSGMAMLAQNFESVIAEQGFTERNRPVEAACRELKGGRKRRR